MNQTPDIKHNAKAIIMGICSSGGGKNQRKWQAYGALHMAKQLGIFDYKDGFQMITYIQEVVK